MNKILCNRLTHCYYVGKVMEWYSRKVLHRGEIYCKEMFVLGYLHDSCKDFELYENCEHHADVVYVALGDYKYAEILKSHDTPSEQQLRSSEPLCLLTMADFIVDGNGEIVGYRKRLIDVAERYGINDISYKTTKEEIELIKMLGFKDDIVLCNLQGIESLVRTAKMSRVLTRL